MISARILNIFKNIIHAASFLLFLPWRAVTWRWESLSLLTFTSDSLCVQTSSAPFPSCGWESWSDRCHNTQARCKHYLLPYAEALPHLCMQPRFPQFLTLLCCSPGAEDVALVISSAQASHWLYFRDCSTALGHS